MSEQNQKSSLFQKIIDFARSPRYVLGTLVGVFLMLQMTNFLPPFQHSNPPVTFEMLWDSPTTEAMMRESCYACHSNETEWPWYSFVAPVSWFVVDHVDDGRDELNFSTGNELETEEIIETIRDEEMPPAYYTIMHPGAALDDAEKEILIQGVIRSLGPENEGDDEDDEHEDDDD